MNEKHLKPIYWGIFSVGGTIASLLLAPLVLIICLLLPTGFLGNTDKFYQSVHQFVSHPVVYLLFAGLIFTLVWHGVHRFYYILHDIHIHVGNATRIFFYSIAIFSFIASLYIGLA